MSELLCGIDIGGTKSYCVLFDKDGKVYSARKTRGGTPVDFSKKDLVPIYEETVLGAFEAAAGNEIISLYISVATYEMYVDFMEKTFSEAVAKGCRINGQKNPPAVEIEPDGLCLVSAELGHNDGAAMICGTGSSLYIRTGETYFRVGGWGQYFGSVGSGFQLARLAIKAALKSYDGIKEPTLLTDLLNAKAGKEIWNMYDELYAGGRSYVASFAGCVFEAAKKGDKAALEVFNLCAGELAELPAAAQKKAGKSLTIIMNGGIFTNFPEYAREVQRLSPPDTKFIMGSVPPVYGCAVEAMHLLGLDSQVDGRFKENFIKGL